MIIFGGMAWYAFDIDVWDFLRESLKNNWEAQINKSLSRLISINFQQNKVR